MSSAADRPGQDDDLRGNPGADQLEPREDATPEELEADIARTRRELGETVEALSDRLDPTAEAGRQVEHLKERARDQVDHARESAQSTLTHARHVVADPGNPAPGLLATATGAALFAAVGLLITRRR